MRTPFIALICAAFILNTLAPLRIQAQELSLPKPGVMVHRSPEFNPPILKGIKVHTDNPFRFDFILDQGDSLPHRGEGKGGGNELKEQSTKLIKYFLASLTIPEKDLWVNLSPYEKDRIVPESFGQTEMGRDLLAEDYMLKQITASLIYPEDEVGKKFWKRIYEEAQNKFGTTNIPVNTFNKVWIVPEKAVVYENAKAGTAYVVESRLKVMLEEDYLSLEKHSTINSPPLVGGVRGGGDSQNPPALTLPTKGEGINQLGSQIIREIVIPELTKEVNQGKNFAQLRQVYNSLILATWYKKKIKDSILSQVYKDKNKVAGVNIDDPQEKQRIYEQYLKAFKKGVYSYIKEDIDPVSQERIPRKYFSGGVVLEFGTGIDSAMRIEPMPRIIGLGLGDNEVQIQTMFTPFRSFLKNLTGTEQQSLPIKRTSSLFPEEQVLIDRIKQSIGSANENAIDSSLKELDSLVRSRLRSASNDYNKWLANQLLELDTIANEKGFVIQRSPLGVRDEHLFVLYRIYKIIVDHTSQGDVRNFLIGQVTQFTDGLLRGNPGWSGLFNNYTVTFHDYYEMHQQNIDRIVSGASPFHSSGGVSRRQAQIINHAAFIISSLLIKAFKGESRQRRIALQEESTRIHERDHEVRRRIANLKEGDALHLGLDEQLAELKSIIEAEEPLHILAHILELAVGGTEFAWDILRG
ncbi:MAG: hypothetical protein HQL15_03505, partial [Candidatus Omnitrophica bacterium]|nr:hypothetical protein [Candidatus Omnitrophota bacterium]